MGEPTDFSSAGVAMLQYIQRQREEEERARREAEEARRRDEQQQMNKQRNDTFRRTC
jgi:hypothetical protein